MSVYTAKEGAPKGRGLCSMTLYLRGLKDTLHRAYRIIALPNASSVHLHQKFGFHLTGTLSEVSMKLDRWIDVAWYEKHLD